MACARSLDGAPFRSQHAQTLAPLLPAFLIVAAAIPARKVEGTLFFNVFFPCSLDCFGQLRLDCANGQNRSAVKMLVGRTHRGSKYVLVSSWARVSKCRGAATRALSQRKSRVTWPPHICFRQGSGMGSLSWQRQKRQNDSIRPPVSAAHPKKKTGMLLHYEGLFTPRLAALALNEIAALCLLRWPVRIAFAQWR